MLDKIKTLSKETLIYGTNTIIGRFLGFLFVPLYTNVFSPGEFGIVANVYAYIAILNVFFTIGLESGYFRFAATLDIGTDKQNFSHPFLGIFINSVVLSSLLLFFSDNFTGFFMVDESRSYLIRLTAIILFFDAVAIVPFAYLRLHHKPVKFVFFKIIGIIINVSLNFILILGFKLGIESVFISNVVSSVFTVLLLLPVIISNLTLSFNKKLLEDLLKFSLPYIPAGISSNLIQVINRPMLFAITKDATAVGIFQANYRLGIFMMLFVSMFEFAWRPFFMQNFKLPDAKKIFAKILTVFVIIGAFIFISLTLFIDDIVRIPMPGRGTLIGKAYWSGITIVPFILFAYYLNGIYVNLMAGIYIEKKTNYLVVITGSAALLSVIANLLLIPSLGIYGAAISSVVSYLAMVVGIFIVSHKFYPVEYEYRKIATVFLVIGLLVVLYYLFFTGLLIFKIIIVLIFLVSVPALKIISISSLKEFLNFK